MLFVYCKKTNISNKLLNIVIIYSYFVGLVYFVNKIMSSKENHGIVLSYKYMICTEELMTFPSGIGCPESCLRAMDYIFNTAKCKKSVISVHFNLFMLIPHMTLLICCLRNLILIITLIAHAYLSHEVT